MHDLLSCSPDLIVRDYLAEAQRVLLFGAGGTGKSTLAENLARIFQRNGRACLCIGAGPGSPAFGVPGAVCLASWQNDSWQPEEIVALCSLDAGRFRLPLTEAVRYLAGKAHNELLLVDAPGVARSVAGAELLTGLAGAASVDTVIAVCRNMEKIPLSPELKSLNCEVVYVQASENARPPGSLNRTRLRTGLWKKYLHQAVVKRLPSSEMTITGTPPPMDNAAAWRGRQIGLLKEGRTLAMGEVLLATENYLKILTKSTVENPDQIVCRDAGSNRQGYLTTIKPLTVPGLDYLPPPDVKPYQYTEKDTGPRPVIRIGDATAVLVNGIFGDPLLHLRLHNRKRSILFDLGEGGRLPARLAHQVSHVFISHAHFDHISGFLWLLRSRIGDVPPCTLYGPPGLAKHIAGLISGIHWDRIGNWGPRFTVRELHGDKLKVYSLKAGIDKKATPAEEQVPGEFLLKDSDCMVRAVTLAHAGIPSLAYSLELAPKINVKKEKLSSIGQPAGQWLGELKKHITANEREAVIILPDNSRARSGDLADELLTITPPQKLAYATDLSDTPLNREKLVRLAGEAYFFFCEAAFLAADRQYAELSGHLTTFACGEIALAAGVENLVPFHFSRRYEKKPQELYREIRSVCSRVVLPPDRPVADNL